MNTCELSKEFCISSDPDVIHLLPVSGGADSSALALLLHEKFPHIKFKMLMSDTGAEEPETYEFLKKIEEKTGNSIEMIKADYDLFEYIDKYNGYLPSSQARWCTRELKLKPFQKWISQFKGQKVKMYIGIRADESSRIAFTIENVDTIMPFIEMNWNRDKVFQYLSNSIGIPSQYKTRTRSGCSVCPFVRRQETIGLLQRRPIEFIKGAKYEKLSDEDITRHQPGVPLWKDSSISENWHSLPMPGDQDSISGKAQKGDDLFGNSGIFVAGEFFLDSMPGLPSFVWHQRVISYSTTLHGLKRQINDRFQHLLRTSEVYEMSPEDVRKNAKFAIWYVEMPADVLDINGPGNESYTWQNGQSYAQVRHITEWVTRALHADFMSRQANSEISNILSVEYEWKEGSICALKKIKQSGTSVGQVIGGMWYQPKEEEPEMTEEEELSLLPCPMCHI